MTLPHLSLTTENGSFTPRWNGKNTGRFLFVLKCQTIEFRWELSRVMTMRKTREVHVIQYKIVFVLLASLQDWHGNNLRICINAAVPRLGEALPTLAPEASPPENGHSREQVGKVWSPKQVAFLSGYKEQQVGEAAAFTRADQWRETSVLLLRKWHSPASPWHLLKWLPAGVHRAGISLSPQRPRELGTAALSERERRLADLQPQARGQPLLTPHSGEWVHMVRGKPLEPRDAGTGSLCNRLVIP